jgi:hypothetical protein
LATWWPAFAANHPAGGAVSQSSGLPNARIEVCKAFDEDDARFFFGREAVTQQLIEVIRQKRFLAVVGPSSALTSTVCSTPCGSRQETLQVRTAMPRKYHIRLLFAIG